MASYAKPELVTFTGIDERTDLVAVQELAARYPRAEFALLVSKSKTGNENRFPSLSFAKQFIDCRGTRRALHICGAWAESIMRCERPVLPVDTSRFRRIQVNHREPSPNAIWDYAAGYNGIAQCHGETFPASSSVMWLFDRSGGTGKRPKFWPDYPGRFVGYAGGINPDNVIETLELIGAQGKYWIDMETGVRTDDWFDLAKCEQVLRAVYGS